MVGHFSALVWKNSVNTTVFDIYIWQSRHVPAVYTGKQQYEGVADHEGW